MNDNDNDDNRGRPRGRSEHGRTSGAKPPRPPRAGDRPFRARREEGNDAGPRREKGDRPFRARSEGGAKPFRPSKGWDDKPARGRRDEGERPRSARPDRERPFRARHDDERPRRGEPVKEAIAAEPVEERIAKVIARAGIASRRDAEVMIGEGRVTLNGEAITSPAVNVTAKDLITVDGEKLPARERTRLWIFHKPRGLVTTARDPEGRPTVFEALPEDMPRVVAVGRLDINTEGLLLLTNDGGLARVIAHPETGWLRRYKVRAHGDVTQADLDRLADGITIDEMEYGPVEARLDRVQGDNVWITLGLREGKNREVKRILEHLGLVVNRLIRLSFGPFQLGDIEPGLVEEVRTKVLKDQLGETLAEEAGVDFESPVREPIAPFGSPKAKERAEREPRPRREDGERPPSRRGFEDRPRDHRHEEAPKRPSRNEPRKSVWRADEDERPAARKVPRRGADPRAARAASAERAHERVGAIKSGAGRKVVVERLVSPRRDEDEAPARKPRSAKRPTSAPPREAPRADDRPRRRTEGDRPFRKADDARPARRDDDRPRRPRAEGDRLFRKADDARPARRDDDRPRRPRAEGDRPFRKADDARPPRRDDDRPRRPRAKATARSGKPTMRDPRAGTMIGPAGPAPKATARSGKPTMRDRRAAVLMGSARVADRRGAVPEAASRADPRADPREAGPAVDPKGRREGAAREDRRRPLSRPQHRRTDVGYHPPHVGQAPRDDLQHSPARLRRSRLG